MIPRSERSSIYIVVAVCLIAIIAGGIGLAQALGGNAKAPPEYESRPSPKVAVPTDIALVNTDDASRPPISDAEFELFHRVSRIVTPRMATSGWQSALAPFVASGSVISQAAPQVKQYLPYVKGKQLSEARDIDVRRPTTVIISGSSGRRAVERNGSAASVLISGRSLDGTRLPPSRIYVQYVWERKGSGQWRITSVDPLYQPADDPKSNPDSSSVVGG